MGKLKCGKCGKTTDELTLVKIDGKPVEVCALCLERIRLETNKKLASGTKKSKSESGLPELKKVSGRWIIRPVYLNEDEWKAVQEHKTKSGLKYADIYRMAIRAFLGFKEQSASQGGESKCPKQEKEKKK